MPELFIELLSEEIPARMQAAAEEQFAEKMVQALNKQGLGGNLRGSWSGPRRLALSIGDVSLGQSDRTEELRGPRADAPQLAKEGFLRSVGLTEDKLTQRETPKGNFLFAVKQIKGRPASEILPDLLGEVLAGFKWPKSMRWSVGRRPWVRPLHRISILFDGVPVEGSADFGDKIIFGDKTIGHRMVSPQEIELTGGDDYAEKLAENHVIAGRAERIATIKKKMNELAKSQNCTVKADDDLLNEVAGLVEYPHPIMGAIDRQFMDLPPEILIASMRGHQKYFALVDDDGGLLPHFITIANMPPDAERDATIRQNNERVLRARLADAEFFWQQDCKTGLDGLAAKLKNITFFEGLGTMADKTKRLEKIFAESKWSEESRKSATYAKADLASATVGEFPELQGIVGAYLYKKEAGESADDEVFNAIKNQYKQTIPADEFDDAIFYLSLIDKLDTLVGFFGKGQIPTGSRDPFALRRAALGIVRLFIQKGNYLFWYRDIVEIICKFYEDQNVQLEIESHKIELAILDFTTKAFKEWMRGEGYRYDIIDAVMASKNIYDVYVCYMWIKILIDFLPTAEGRDLLAMYRRIDKILPENGRQELGLSSYSPLFEQTESEKKIYDAVVEIENYALNSESILLRGKVEDIKKLSSLRPLVDDFFETTKINDDNPQVRQNRLHLLGAIFNLTQKFADLSLIEGEAKGGGNG